MRLFSDACNNTDGEPRNDAIGGQIPIFANAKGPRLTSFGNGEQIVTGINAQNSGDGGLYTFLKPHLHI